MSNAAGSPKEAPLPRVCLAGVGGFGRQHLANLLGLQERGRLRLVAAVDPFERSAELPPDVPTFACAEDLLDSGLDIDILVVAAPIASHSSLATLAVRLGADLLLEKPPVASLGQFHALLEATGERGLRVQVGFQSIGSHALPAIGKLFADGTIGDLRAVSATGLWLRTRGYFVRSAWSGRRTLRGLDVVDGVVTNPLAHAVMTALHVAGATSESDLQELELELHRANAIETDDTSVVRARTAAGIPVTCALTLCAAEQQDPWVTIEGTTGSARFYYTRDELVVTTEDGAATTTTYGRTNLMEDLLDRRVDGRRLLCPLEDTGAFMTVLEGVRTAPDPGRIPAEHLRWVGEGDEAHAVIDGIEGIFARVVRGQTGLSGLGVPWAASPPLSETPEALTMAGVVLAQTRLGTQVAPTSSPRPVLHPVRTISGTVVTDYQPLDHPWHLGVGVAVQDVNGANLWGGRTYTRDAGRYTWRPDHGRVDREAARLQPWSEAVGLGRLTECLAWRGPDGATLLHEDRLWTWAPLGGGVPTGWALRLDFTLTTAGPDPLELGSPGSHGREGGGYGGFFWRLPEVTAMDVFSQDAEGEEAVHGSVSPWVAVTGCFSRPDQSRAHASLVLHAEDDDPWFVRCASYPGLGRSLAWTEPLQVRPTSPVERTVTVAVLDGRLDREGATAVAGRLASLDLAPASTPGA